MQGPEHILVGGNIASSVVRVGSTVRKPATAATPFITDFLRYLRSAGFTACPKTLGLDPHGRQVLEFIPGQVGASETAFTLDDLAAVGFIIRQLHDLATSYPIPSDARVNLVMEPDGTELLCHNDLAPWNFVRGPKRWAFIDWDAVAPGSRLWDLAYAAITFPPIERSSNPEEVVTRIAALTRGYEITSAQRDALPGIMRRRAIAMRDLLIEGHRTGKEPWASLFLMHHATYWNDVADFVAAHLIKGSVTASGASGP